jgi:GNAT superfamily N-acetyltransferase
MEDSSPGRARSSREREFAMLEEELRALGADIAAARSTAARAQGPLRLGRHHESPVPGLAGDRVRLPDGAEIVIRPVGTDDAPLLRLTLEHLGALSRYRRFREPVDHFSTHELDELTHADHRTREALVALDPLAGEGVGVAAYVRDAHDPEGAEVTYLVTDEWQRRGVGRALLERLAERARAAGLQRFTATTLVGSEDARRLLTHVADPVREHRDGGIVEITAQLRSSGPPPV